MWANENWTRAWDGSEEDILLAQSHDVMPPGDYIRSVLPVLADPRYIRVDGAALVAVYRAKQLPDPAKTFTQWREIASESGIGELFILCVEGSAEYDEDLPPVSELQRRDHDLRTARPGLDSTSQRDYGTSPGCARAGVVL